MRFELPLHFECDYPIRTIPLKSNVLCGGFERVLPNAKQRSESYSGIAVVKMGLRARLDAMESHSTAQHWKRQRCFRATSGLASLCSPDGSLAHAPADGYRSILENNYYKQKESLSQFVSSSVVRRSALNPNIGSNKSRFPLDEASTFDPLGIVHFGSHPYDAPASVSAREHHLQDFQLHNDSTSSRMQRQPFPSSEKYSAAETLVDMHGSDPADVRSSLNDVSAAEALVDMHAASSQHAMKAATTCSISREPSTHSGSLRMQQVHRETMSRETLCQAFETSLTLPKTVSAPISVGGIPKQEPLYKQLLEKRHADDARFKELKSKIEVEEALLESLRRTKQALFECKKKESIQLPTSAAFTPLSEEEEEEVCQALNGSNRHEVLVQHEASNIDLSRATLQCLKPGAWLNDEVINLYMELLKERECREQKLYLKCHFFNTFFFNKLYKDARSYDYKAVRRWTTQRKLGYSLLECDKIFVPIHKDIHWCLAVINLREKKLQYLDSLKGQDLNALQALARYIRDEAKDKGAEVVDISSWELDCPKDIPEQMNGCDCGMFMIKYADFLSRGEELKFTQENMEYFRKRTVLELLQLKVVKLMEGGVSTRMLLTEVLCGHETLSFNGISESLTSARVDSTISPFIWALRL
ncbi:hypothetical protein GOP47_0015431 [Adiantum capillus-veneris]|uniref:Ubiquitin-like protease family profile domain-containing protein n=1 Tax=Adiantum capillus-veneris TaxID=13818 RepID=A0A9D4ZD69_ADICA|nr:hypothetical protein GOP47_0015431 [Adiantum capillus-veneris]